MITIKKPLLVWTQEREVGLPIIDEQHRGIVSLINSLHFLSTQRPNSFIVEATVDMIDRYVKLHGYTEEMFFQQYHYPGIEAHQSEHIGLLNKLNELRNDSSVSVQECAKCFMEYFINHVEEGDRKYALFIQALIASEAQKEASAE